MKQLRIHESKNNHQPFLSLYLLMVFQILGHFYAGDKHEVSTAKQNSKQEDC
jgi:hypothetical protein